MSPETEINLALVLSVLRMLQEEGSAPPPGQVSPEYISRLADELELPVSAKTIRRTESIALLKLRSALSE